MYSRREGEGEVVWQDNVLTLERERERDRGGRGRGRKRGRAGGGEEGERNGGMLYSQK